MEFVSNGTLSMFQCVRMSECFFRSMFPAKETLSKVNNRKNRAKPKNTTRKQLFYAGAVSSKMAKSMKGKLTGKKLGPIGPPGIPSFGGNCPIGLGAGPAFC